MAHLDFPEQQVLVHFFGRKKKVHSKAVRVNASRRRPALHVGVRGVRNGLMTFLHSNSFNVDALLLLTLACDLSSSKRNLHRRTR